MAYSPAAGYSDWHFLFVDQNKEYGENKKTKTNVWYKDHKGFKMDIDVDFGIILPVFLMSTWITIYLYLIEPVVFKCIMNTTDEQKV